MTVTFPVPSTTTSRFAVAADHIPHDLAALLRGPHAFEPHITGRLGSPPLDLRREDLGDLRWDPAQIKAVHPGQRRDQQAFGSATQFAVVTSTAPITDQPRGVQVARAAAYAIAAATDGVVADLIIGDVLPQPTAERTSFVLADNWLGDALPPFRANGRCTAADPDRDPEGVNGCSCVRLRTHGLRRFGLPELQITDVACPHDLAALNVLRTTARHLLTDHWSWLATGPVSRTRTISAVRRLTQGDFNEFWGSSRREHLSPPIIFEARLTPITARLLSVHPPHDFDGTVNDWLWGDALPLSIRDILSSPADIPLPRAA
ncbi:hypothetical protein [Actinomadura macra]|uniref:hypothetical protein n=1 Tax=Actinomadura macra TaxID=46164 RepID=UPI0008356131|nr:hypothetical protein [Actinomadura macra]